VFSVRFSSKYRAPFLKGWSPLAKARDIHRGFCCWDQFVSMLFCQLGQAQSLREIYEGLQASEGKLVHLGMKKSPASRHTYLRQ